jgi:hypothetical protein
VAGRLRQRPVLTPAGHPAVGEARVRGEAVIRPEPKALGDAGPEAFDQRVCAAD